MYNFWFSFRLQLLFFELWKVSFYIWWLKILYDIWHVSSKCLLISTNATFTFIVISPLVIWAWAAKPIPKLKTKNKTNILEQSYGRDLYLIYKKICRIYTRRLPLVSLWPAPCVESRDWSGAIRAQYQEVPPFWSRARPGLLKQLLGTAAVLPA